MTHARRPITILMADDDPDDRQMTKEAFEESQLANDLRFVEDGVELMDYLQRRGKYSDPASSPRPGLILLDLNMPRKDGREALREIKADPELEAHPGRRPDDLEGRGGHLPHVQPVGRVVHHQAGDVRGPGRRRQDAGQVLARDRRAARRAIRRGRMHDRPIRVLLVDDDEDDYVLTRDLLADIPGTGSGWTGSPTPRPRWRRWAEAGTTST